MSHLVTRLPLYMYTNQKPPHAILFIGQLTRPPTPAIDYIIFLRRLTQFEFRTPTQAYCVENQHNFGVTSKSEALHTCYSNKMSTGHVVKFERCFWIKTDSFGVDFGANTI